LVKDAPHSISAAPDPARGAYSAHHADPLAAFKGPKRRDGKERNELGWERKSGDAGKRKEGKEGTILLRKWK